MNAAWGVSVMDERKYQRNLERFQSGRVVESRVLRERNRDRGRVRIVPIDRDARLCSAVRLVRTSSGSEGRAHGSPDRAPPTATLQDLRQLAELGRGAHDYCSEARSFWRSGKGVFGVQKDLVSKFTHG